MKPLEPSLPGETRSEYIARVDREADKTSHSYLLGIAEETLREIVANKNNKNWRKPECVYAAERALERIKQHDR